jgi:acetylxylan esterase
LAGTYPDVFKAGSVYSGVPAGCFYTGTVNGWNSACANGQVTHTAAEWATTVKNMYPGYSGSYPRMLIYHGDADTTLYPRNYEETVKQWAGVFGYDTVADTTTQNDPASPFTKYKYGDNLVAALGRGITHNIPHFESKDLEWFGIVVSAKGSA